MDEQKKCGCGMCDKMGMCHSGKWHKIIKIVLLIVVLLFIGKCIFGGNEYNRNDIQKDTITVSGKGEIMVKPDIATISFSVLAENMDVGKAQTDSATKMNNIIAYLKTNGVDEKDIKTTDYSIYPRYDYVNSTIYPNNGTQKLAGYDVNQSVEVKIRDLTKAGSILGGIGGLGVTNISGLTFGVDKEDDVKIQARGLAVEDAKTQAKTLAKSLGVKLVKITSFSESNNSPIYYAMGVAKMSASVASVAPQLPAGQNTVTSNVSITYEIR